MLDDTDKVGGGAAGALDQKRYNWLVNELDEGQAADELMIICAHIPLRPYAQMPQNAADPYWTVDYLAVSEWVLSRIMSPNRTVARHTPHLYELHLVVLGTCAPQHHYSTTRSNESHDPEYGFWEVETPSLRDFPGSSVASRSGINSDKNISIFALDVDVAANPALLGRVASPAMTSRSYAIGATQIFQQLVKQGPMVVGPSFQFRYLQCGACHTNGSTESGTAGEDPEPLTGCQLFQNQHHCRLAESHMVILNNTVVGSTLVHGQSIFEL